MPDMERVGFWSTISKIYHDQYRCSGMIFQILRVQGKLTPEIIRKALSWLQMRHPLLRAHFVEDDHYYRFQVDHYDNRELDEKIAGVPLCVVKRADDAHWLKITEDELCRDFDPESRKLWRMIFLHSENSCHSNEIITFIHHAISDGVSITGFAHELLSFCRQIATGTNHVPDLEVLPLLPAAELMLPEIPPSCKFSSQPPQNHSSEEKQTPWNFQVDQPLNERRARILYFQLDEAIMTQLRACCKRQHTTVNSALIAALLISTFNKTDSIHHVCFSFAINLRTFCEPKVDNEHFGCYIMMEQARITLSQNISFWDLTHNCSKEIEKQIDIRQRQGFLPKKFHKSFLSSMMVTGLSKSNAQQQFSGGPALSNLGVLDLSEKYGPFQLKEIYTGAPQVSGLYMVFLCVSTFREKLFCTLSYTEPLLSREAANSIADSFVSQLEIAGKTG